RPFLHDSLRHRPQSLRDAPRTGDDVAALEVALAAGEVGELAARLLDQQSAGGDVPRRQTELEESVEDAGRHAGEVQGGGARSPERARPEEDLLEAREVRVDLRAVAEGEPGRDERAVEPRATGDRQTRVVAPRAAALLGGVHLVAERVPPHRRDELL